MNFLRNGGVICFKETSGIGQQHCCIIDEAEKRFILAKIMQ